MKKVICIVLLLLLVVAGVGFVLRQTMWKTEEEDDIVDGMSQKEYNRYLLTEIFPTEIIVVGPQMTFDASISVRVEDRLTEESIRISKGYRHCIIIVNDHEGTAPLADDEYKLIWDYLNRDSRYFFMYIGTRQLEHLVELGYHFDGEFTEQDVSLAYIQEKGSLAAVVGALVQETYEEYPDAIIDFFSLFIERRYTK